MKDVCVCVSSSIGPTLHDLMACSRPGSCLHGILQARILELVAIPFSRGSSQPRILYHLSHQVNHT